MFVSFVDVFTRARKVS